MTRRVLLVGLRDVVVDDALAQLGIPDLGAVSCTNLDDVRAALGASPVAAVVIGAGLDLEVRLEIVREVFTRTDSTTVHLKDRASGPAGFLPFARSVLT
ncbi:MAG: hypothetical protein ABJA74_12125 [Lapillicoccus sp.]